MTAMQAAIGLCQLRKLPGWTAARARNSEIMREALREVPGLRVPETPGGHAHYRCVAFTTGASAAARRDQALRALHRAGLPSLQGSCGEIYLEQAFQARNISPAARGQPGLDSAGRLPVARLLGETSLTFLVHHTIDESTMREYATACAKVLRRVLAPSSVGVPM